MSIIHSASGDAWNPHDMGMASRRTTHGTSAAAAFVQGRASLVHEPDEPINAIAIIGSTCIPNAFVSDHAAYAICPKYGALQKS